jgi:hypothetical protein
LSRSDSRFFARREFAGYLVFRIPHQLDDKVLVAISDPQRRAAMTPEDVDVLSVFGHRKAVEAVRNSTVQTLMDGFLAVAVAIDLQGDMREVFMALAPLFRSAELLNAQIDDLVASLISQDVSNQAVDEVRRFAERPISSRSLSAFGLREEGASTDFRYI